MDNQVAQLRLQNIYGRGLQDAVEHLTMDANKRTDESSFIC